MQAAENNAETLRQHISATYANLRVGVGLIGFALPVFLWAGGVLVERVWLRESMSAYYHSPLRNIFVGLLVTIGFFLYLYKGFSTKENWALNLAGVFAIGVAMFPTTTPTATATLASRVHGVCAVAFFLCIAYVSIFRAKDTLSLLKNPREITWLRRSYRTLGGGMILSPVIAVLLMFMFEPDTRGRSFVFWVEAVAVWMFAAYWLLKSYELRKTGAEQLALAGEVKAIPEKQDPENTGRLVRVPAAEVSVSGS